MTKEDTVVESATISRLKASLSEYLGKVKSGEELIVTDRGVPIAKIVPLNRSGLAIPPHLLTLERQGAVRIGTGKLPRALLDRPRPSDPEGRILKALLEEREEGS